MGPYWYWHGWGWHGGYGFDPFFAILSLVMWIAFIVIAVLIIRKLLHHSCHGHEHHHKHHHKHHKGAGPGHGNPLDILKVRYARGEIDAAEFEEKKRHLTS